MFFLLRRPNKVLTRNEKKFHLVYVSQFLLLWFSWKGRIKEKEKKIWKKRIIQIAKIFPLCKHIIKL